jgi:hypothetical protein
MPRLPLSDAAQIAYETAEEAGLAGVAYGADQTPAKKLVHFMDTLMAEDIRFFGKKPPSRRIAPIPKTELENLHPKLGSNELTDVVGTRVEYTDVSLSRFDFWRYLRRLRREVG